MVIKVRTLSSLNNSPHSIISHFTKKKNIYTSFSLPRTFFFFFLSETSSNRRIVFYKKKYLLVSRFTLSTLYEREQNHNKKQTETCSFSQWKIYPGKGRTFIEKNGKLHRFINSKCESMHHQKKKSQKLTWTTMWRTLHKKGAQTLSSRKTRKKRVIRSSRNIGTVSMADIQKKKSEKSEFRKAQIADATRKLKERRKARKAARKTTGPRPSKAFQKTRRR